jgi:ectoine hydroxylase-related dioxygenase (phytanoyl-CoA dioxygenase family)
MKNNYTISAVNSVGPLSAGWITDPTVPKHLKDQWSQDGFSVIRGAYSLDQINSYNNIVKGVRAVIDDGKDECGLGDRIGQLHQKFPELLELASNQNVINFLKWAFGDDPIVFGSLNFDKGSQQDAHIDAIFFWPEPSYSMCGCWVALEDIHIDAGPLFYIPNSHLWRFIHSEDVISYYPELAARRLLAQSPEYPAVRKAEIAAEMGNAWTEVFKKLEKDRSAERIPMCLKAGDVVFWHSLLAHGGMPRVDLELSRKSVVFHYIGKKTKLYTFEQFMLYDYADMLSQRAQDKKLATYKEIEYMRYPYFVTYTRDGQKIHPL